jgi:hypothetical protein
VKESEREREFAEEAVNTLALEPSRDIEVE